MNDDKNFENLESFEKTISCEEQLERFSKELRSLTLRYLLEYDISPELICSEILFTGFEIFNEIIEADNDGETESNNAIIA